MLVDTGERVILIDTGAGTKVDEKYRKIHYLFGNENLVGGLLNLGYKPEDITDIIHTHLHHDHCGGTIKYDESGNLVPAFPNAILWVSREQWETALHPNAREKAAFFPENILPMEKTGKLQLLDQDTELYPGIRVELHYGHTRGLMVVYIRVGRGWVVFASDFIPTAHHVYEPYIMSYDMCAEKTLEEKAKFFEWALVNDHCVFFQHDYFNECGIIHRTEKGHKVKELITLEDYLSRVM
jgi:glyoxylase-like metal-dependent hydrolase (beta-lactamase superfamily II)